MVGLHEAINAVHCQLGLVQAGACVAFWRKTLMCECPQDTRAQTLLGGPASHCARGCPRTTRAQMWAALQCLSFVAVAKARPQTAMLVVPPGPMAQNCRTQPQTCPEPCLVNNRLILETGPVCNRQAVSARGCTWQPAKDSGCFAFAASLFDGQRGAFRKGHLASLRAAAELPPQQPTCCRLGTTKAVASLSTPSASVCASLLEYLNDVPPRTAVTHIRTSRGARTSRRARCPVVSWCV